MIHLIPCAEEHRWLLYGWRNSAEVARYMYDDRPIAEADHDRWYSALLADENRWGWVVAEDDTPVGAGFLTDYRPHDRRAAFGLYLAEGAQRGRGVGRAALCLICEFAFDRLGLHKLIGEALSFNSGAIALYGRLGFVAEGELRDQFLRDGQWVGVHLMALFEDGLAQLRANAVDLRDLGRIA